MDSDEQFKCRRNCDGQCRGTLVDAIGCFFPEIHEGSGVLQEICSSNFPLTKLPHPKISPPEVKV